MNILQVNTSDIGGGAEKVAWSLFQAYRARGHESRLAVGFRSTDGPGIFQVPHASASQGWASFWWRWREQLLARSSRSLARRRLAGLAHRLAEPRAWVEHTLGIDDFRFPGTQVLLHTDGPALDILHAHNLHGDYFDLKALPGLSHTIPVIVTLHDTWMLSGHCAYSLTCQRWQTGCGHCPDLTLYPAVRFDNTAHNWRIKQRIYRDSYLWITTPSCWLMDQLDRSMLAPAIKSRRVIPNGIDLSIFRPGDKHAVRVGLDLPQDALILLFVAVGATRGSYKDFPTLKAAIEILAKAVSNRRLVLIALGDTAQTFASGSVEVRVIPFTDNPAQVARYYQAADIYVHAARAENYPTVILEAMACGLPVVASRVGGIPEQVDHGVTGFLAAPADPQDLAHHVQRLIDDENLRHAQGERAAQKALQHFDLERQVDAYLSWYGEAISAFPAVPPAIGHA